MLIINTKDGRSRTLDLHEESSRAEWAEIARTASFQSQITSLTLVADGVRYSLPRPRSAEDIFFHAESVAPSGAAKGGDRVVVQVGEVRVTLFVHRETRAVRVDVEQTGRLVFNPIARSPHE